MLTDRLGALSRTRCGHVASRPGTPALPCKPAAAQAPRRIRSRYTAVVCKAANKTLYEVLGVSQDATERDIKRAFRQKALKLHPDVNKAPDAQAQFMEAKNAFTVLSDKEQRAEYNRKLRMGFYTSDNSWGSPGDFGDFTGGYGSQQKQRRKQQEEEFYGLADLFYGLGKDTREWLSQQEWSKKVGEVPRGLASWARDQASKIPKGVPLEDFFNDLGKELDKLAKERPSDKPMSLWEELAAIGEELVEYMEDSLGIKEGQEEKLGAKSALDEYEARFGSAASRSTSSGSSPGSTQQRQRPQHQQQQQRPRPPEPTKLSAEEDIDEMLAALKRKMNR